MSRHQPRERLRRTTGAVVATTSLLCLAAVEFVAFAVLVPAPSVAYHPRGDQAAGGGIPLFVIAPIVVVVAVGIIALGVWGRKKPKGKAARRRARKR